MTGPAEDKSLHPRDILIVEQNMAGEVMCALQAHMGADIKYGIDEGTNLYPNDILILDEVRYGKTCLQKL